MLTPPLPPSELILDHRIHAIPLSEALSCILGGFDEAHDDPMTVAFLNATSIDHGLREDEVSSALADLDLALPDGVSIVLASRILRGQIRFRYSGIDLLKLCLDLEGRTHFFFGSQSATLERIAGRIERDFPHARQVGHFAPPMWPWDPSIDDEVLDHIAEVKPDFLWVGLTAPKQELWLARHRRRIQARVGIAVGYAFDTLAGTRQLAPDWIRRCGLEWFYRLLQDPRRIWRRVVVQSPSFLLKVLATRLRDLSP